MFNTEAQSRQERRENDTKAIGQQHWLAGHLFILFTERIEDIEAGVVCFRFQYTVEPQLGEAMGNRRLARVCLLLFSAGLWIGCNSNTGGRYAITGTVNLDKSPLPKGMISFQPLENGRLSSGAVIADGKFSIPADRGLPVGKYRVEVHAGSGGAPAADPSAPPGSGPPPGKDIIPPDWGDASKQTIDVKKEGPFNFAFEIATKGK